MNKDFPRTCLFFIPTLEGGGAERIMLTVYQQFKALGIPAVLVVNWKKGVLYEAMSPKEKSSIIELKAKSTLQSFVKLYLACKKNDAIVMISTLVNANISAILAKFLSLGRLKAILREANTPSVEYEKAKMYGRVILSIAKRFYKWADVVIGVSKGVSEDMVAFYKLNPNKVKTIYNPVLDINSLAISSQNLLIDPPFGTTDEINILAVGNVKPQKDYLTLVKGLELFLKKYPNAKLSIAGAINDPDYFDQIRTYIVKSGLERNIKFLGFSEDAQSLMKACDVFVLSSIYEGLPGSLVQAFGANCRIVSTDCKSGPAEILDNGKWGILCPVGDEIGLAEALLRSVSSEFEITKERLKWMKNYDIRTSVDAYRHLYETV